MLSLSPLATSSSSSRLLLSATPFVCSHPDPLARPRATLQGLRDAESRAHAKEVSQLKAAFEERLTEAVEKVRSVHATNRDAVAILQMNKKLKMEVARLKHDMVAALAAAAEAEAREERRKEEGDQVVQQLLGQLREKESLLAAGAGAMTEEEREEMLQKERQRSQQAAEKEKARIEAAMAEERAKATERLSGLQEELTTVKRSLAEAKVEAELANRALDKERKQLAKTLEEKTKLEAQWNAEQVRRERVIAQEKVVGKQRVDIRTALGKMRAFTEETREHLNVDLACLYCLRPLLEPQVLVPCGHSICITCSYALDAAAAQNPEFGAKFCPMCTQQREGSRPGSGRHGGEDEDALQPVEGFPNLMLDTVLTRLRTKVQDVQGQINFVLQIFEKGGVPLPGTDKLKGPAASPPVSPSKAGAEKAA